MHPIERLRYVARAGTAPDRILVAESIPAFGAFASKPQMLLVALRQLISRQPDSPGLLALGAHMMNSLDALEAGWSFSDALNEDRTADIAETIAVTESGGTDVIDSIASGRTTSAAIEVLCPLGTRAWIEQARAAGRSVAIVTPLGSRLPPMLWANYLERIQTSNGQLTERLTIEDFDDVIGPEGLGDASSWSPDCPDVAELARL